MKLPPFLKEISLFLIGIAFLASANAQMDTITPCQRYERYLYDSLWADDFSQNCNGNCDLRGFMWQVNFQSPAIVLRPCHSDTLLNIIGIAAPVYEECPIADFQNREPEYFQLYKQDSTGFVLLKSVRWDTAVPHKVMQIYGIELYGWGNNVTDPDDPFASYPCPYPVYEAYFDKPVQIGGDFYVGGTTNHNYCNPINGGGPSPLTMYMRWALKAHGDCWQIIPHGETTDLVRYTGENNYDSTFHGNYYLWPGFGCIFPILQLPGDSIPTQPDTCYGTTGLRLLDVSGRNATLTWNDNGTASQWQLAIIKGDTATATPDNGIINNYGSNLAQLYYLDSTWYTVYVRTVCDADRNVYSEWSNPLHFVIPQPDTAALQTEPTLAERYTVVSPNPTDGRVNVFSSFKISRIEVIATDGKALLSQVFDTHSATIDLPAMPAGTLFVRIRTEAGTVTRKIVKK